MDYKHGVVATQRHGLVLVVSPLVALMVDQRSIDRAHTYVNIIRFTQPACMSFFSLRNNLHFNYVHAQTVCTRPSPLPILEGPA